MDDSVICWGHNPGQRFVKDAITVRGKRKDLTPYPAVIAPYTTADDPGLARRTAELVATVGGRRYLGGIDAERMTLANRQQDAGRLDADSPVYQAFAQMSATHTGLTKRGQRPRVVVATALPVGWRLADGTAELHLTTHIRTALRDLVDLVDVYVQSEPNALVGSAILDDDGQLRPDAGRIARGLICVGDLGGGTVNVTVLDQLRPVRGRAASPARGSGTVVRELAQRRGLAYVDAERQLVAALAAPGADPLADGLLAQYREAVVSLFQESWRDERTAAKLFGGGTVHWVAPALLRAFPGCRIVEDPQRAIARGLYRYARRRART